MATLGVHVRLPRSPAPLLYVFSATNTLNGWILAFFRTSLFLNFSTIISSYLLPAANIPMADILPRLRIMAVIGISSSKASQISGNWSNAVFTCSLTRRCCLMISASPVTFTFCGSLCAFKSSTA
ncbi:hypothetical protein NP493_8g09056 [Ridgeia piscesae]|uniref:Uncharacterized protein n=1 Tax=Ridgeia piscesae TaxID=27915 RepID=A0AAD9ULJ3_RIDPI|nr:hypothetical protein NP493_8g09056 [Ridgeia piscesae]